MASYTCGWQAPSRVYAIEHLDGHPLVEPIFADNGDQISAASSALVAGDHLYVGRALDAGVLKCEYPPRPMVDR